MSLVFHSNKNGSRVYLYRKSDHIMKKLLIVGSLALFSCMAYSQTDGLIAFADPTLKVSLADNESLSPEANSSIEHAWLYIEKGLQYDKSNNLEDALKAFDKAIEINDTIADVWDFRAVTNIKMGKYRRALRDLQEAVELNPGLTDAYNHAGIANYWLSNYHDAIAFYSKAIELKPGYSTPYFNRAIVYLVLEEKGKAYQDLLKAKELGNDGVDKVLNDFFADTK